MNYFVMDRDRYEVASRYGHGFLQMVEYGIVVDKENDVFWYAKNRLTGDHTTKYPLARLKAHQAAIEFHFNAYEGMLAELEF